MYFLQDKTIPLCIPDKLVIVAPEDGRHVVDDGEGFPPAEMRKITVKESSVIIVIFAVQEITKSILYRILHSRHRVGYHHPEGDKGIYDDQEHKKKQRRHITPPSGTGL